METNLSRWMAATFHAISGCAKVTTKDCSSHNTLDTVTEELLLLLLLMVLLSLLLLLLLLLKLWKSCTWKRSDGDETRRKTEVMSTSNRLKFSSKMMLGVRGWN